MTFTDLPGHRELADLLGQVKPSTVSKEDIENSGLEVIKASLLPRYYKENKITANCLDRVSHSPYCRVVMNPDAFSLPSVSGMS